MANYHMTENKYLESILINGLIPQRGVRSNLIGDSKTAVFYSKGYEGAIAMFFMMIEQFVNYRGDIGDMHIDYYNTFMQMASDKLRSGLMLGTKLNEAIEREKKIVDIINKVRSVRDWKEFLGDGVYLKLNNIYEEEAFSSEHSFYNSWTTSKVASNDICVMSLINRKTGEMLSSKYDVIDYFMSKVSLEKMKKILYDTDLKESKRESHLLWKIMSQYYEDNKDLIENCSRKYDLVEIPLSSYLNQKNKKTSRL